MIICVASIKCYRHHRYVSKRHIYTTSISLILRHFIACDSHCTTAIGNEYILLSDRVKRQLGRDGFSLCLKLPTSGFTRCRKKDVRMLGLYMCQGKTFHTLFHGCSRNLPAQHKCRVSFSVWRPTPRPTGRRDSFTNLVTSAYIARLKR